MGAEVLGLLLGLLLFLLCALRAVGHGLRYHRLVVDERGLATGRCVLLQGAFALQPVPGGLGFARRAVSLPLLSRIAPIVEGERLAGLAGLIGVGVAAAPGGSAGR